MYAHDPMAAPALVRPDSPPRCAHVIAVHDSGRFLQPRRDPRLAPEPLLEAGVCGHFRAQQLDRPHAILGGVIGAIHLAHPAEP
jgi:hypothetical protein